VLECFAYRKAGKHLGLHAQEDLADIDSSAVAAAGQWITHIQGSARAASLRPFDVPKALILNGIRPRQTA